MSNLSFTEETKVLGRVGVKASMSGKTIYTPLFKHMQYDGIYLQFVIPEDKSKEFLESIKTLGILGCGVTGPHTHNLMHLVDEVNETAKVTNHGNCLVNKNGSMSLHSTDVAGMMNTLIPLVGSLSGKSVVVLGGGDLMPGILNELSKHSVKDIILYNRTVNKIEKLASDFNCKVGGDLSELTENGKGDVFINATDIGSTSCETKDDCFTDDFLKRFDTVMDATFIPYASDWSIRANKLGLSVGFGFEMFAYQGAQQIRLITGLESDMEFMIPLVKKGLGG